MYTIFNRLSWILAILAFTILTIIHNDLSIAWIILWIVIKLLLSKSFIKNSINEFKVSIIIDIIEKLKLHWINIKDEVVDEIIKNNEIQKNNLDEKITKLESVEKVKNIEEVKDNIIFNENEKVEETKLVEEKIKKPSKIVIFLSDFFAENLMSKIWWILLAIWVIFLMSLVYSVVWPVTKIIIWFIIWFAVYSIWIFIEKKWYKTEWMILLWTWILINYIVILSWKFIIWDNSWFLSAWLTFLLLILNTIFSIVTSFVYSSKHLLLFSFIFAYIIPLITWWNNLNLPYLSLLSVWYSIIVSIWWLIISNYFAWNQNKVTSLQILFITIIWWNILFLTSPFLDSTDFVIKMIWYNLINFASIFLLYKNKFEKSILPAFIISYIFLAFIMFTWHILTWIWVLIMFIISTLWLLIFNTFFVVATIWTWLLYLLFLPIILVLWFLFLWSSWTWIILIPLFLVLYLILFIFFIWNIFTTILKYIFFIFLWLFLVIWNLHLWLDFWITNNSFYTILITSFIFLFSTYFLSFKKDLNYLYSLWTLATIFLLIPIIKIKWEFSFESIISIFIFWILNFLLPFINKNLVKNSSINLVLWSVFWILFMWWNLFRFWNEYFPWITLWFAFLVFAIFYFIGWFLFFNKLEKNEVKDEVKEESNINFIYTFLWIAISLFSIAIALMFSKIPLVISIIWLVESTILFYFYTKLKSKKIYIAWIILFIVWLSKFITSSLSWLQFQYWDLVSIFQYWDLVSILIITIILFLNVILINKDNIFIKILHLIWILIVCINLNLIFNFDNFLKHLLLTSAFVLIIWNIYSFLKDKFLMNSYLVLLILIFIIHIFICAINLFDDRYSLNYIITFILWVIILLQNKIFETNIIKRIVWLFGIYFFIISSIYLYDKTEDSFSLTIYWWILSLIAVHLWIFKLNRNIRLTWIYLLIITILKIIIYDMWNSFDNGIIRVIAFIFIGWVMIYISGLYKKNNLELIADFKSKTKETLNKNEEIIKDN